MRKSRPLFISLLQKSRGVAVFMAALILLSVSILALSTMTRISETSQLAGQTLENRKLAITSDAAMRVALAEITEQFLNVTGSPDVIYVNKTNSANDTDKFRLVEDKRVSPTRPLFGYRAKATLLLVGDGTTVIPGLEFPPSIRNSCYHVVVDTADILSLGNTGVQSDTAMVEGYSGFYFGPQKTIGLTTCFRKKSN